jgi:hypothetical protein
VAPVAPVAPTAAEEITVISAETTVPLTTSPRVTVMLELPTAVTLEKLATEVERVTTMFV